MPASAPDWRPWRRLALAGLVPVAAVVLLGTLGPPSVAEAATWALVRLAARLPGTPTGYDGVQSLANVVMFVPVGALLALGTRPARWPVAVLVGPLVSIAVETLQRGVAGRVSDRADVVANATGSTVGFLAGAVLVGAIALFAGVTARLLRPRGSATA